MKITSIKMYKTKEGNIKAFASIVFENVFVVNNIKVIENTNTGELFISMPNKIVDNGVKDIAHPIDNTFRKYIEEEILNEYKK